MKMSDKTDSLLVRGVKRAVDNGQRQLGKLERPVSWARETISTVIAPRVEQQAVRLLLAMSEPENAQRVQAALAHVAQLGMELGFRADPDAGELFGLVSWLEEQHGRDVVALRVIEHAAEAGSGFRRTLESGLFGLTQPPGSDAHQAAAEQMHQVRDEIARDLLGLLCSLAALEVGEEPSGDIDAQLAFFESAGLPDEFKGLALKAVNGEGAFAQPERPVEDEHSAMSTIARFVPSFDDPHLRFLTLSQLFFIHSYLTRNLIERLPELLADAQNRQSHAPWSEEP